MEAAIGFAERAVLAGVLAVETATLGLAMLVGAAVLVIVALAVTRDRSDDDDHGTTRQQPALPASRAAIPPGAGHAPSPRSPAGRPPTARPLPPGSPARPGAAGAATPSGTAPTAPQPIAVGPAPVDPEVRRREARLRAVQDYVAEKPAETAAVLSSWVGQRRWRRGSPS